MGNVQSGGPVKNFLKLSSFQFESFLPDPSHPERVMKSCFDDSITPTLEPLTGRSLAICLIRRLKITHFASLYF